RREVSALVAWESAGNRNTWTMYGKMANNRKKSMDRSGHSISSIHYYARTLKSSLNLQNEIRTSGWVFLQLFKPANRLTMNLSKFFIVGGFLLVHFQMIAQDNVKLLSNWDYRRRPTAYERIHKVISTTNGYIAAVGETRGERGDDIDGLFILLNAED